LFQKIKALAVDNPGQTHQKLRAAIPSQVPAEISGDGFHGMRRVAKASAGGGRHALIGECLMMVKIMMISVMYAI
jgi:hypothetical protein